MDLPLTFNIVIFISLLFEPDYLDAAELFPENETTRLNNSLSNILRTHSLHIVILFSSSRISRYLDILINYVDNSLTSSQFDRANNRPSEEGMRAI